MPGGESAHVGFLFQVSAGCSGGFAMGRLAMRWTALRRIFPSLGYNPALGQDLHWSTRQVQRVCRQRARTAMIDQDCHRSVSAQPSDGRVRALARERPSSTRAGSRRRRFSIPCRQTPPDPDGPLLAAYLDHLLRVRGLEPKTCEGLLTCRSPDPRMVQDHFPDQPLAEMTGEHVLALVQHFLSLSSQ